MNDLVAQLLGEATSRIWDRLDSYLGLAESVRKVNSVWVFRTKK